ncbi:hypothetical protein GTP91_23980 [Rugamonas sp. FT82W]|uniref:Uncharacterized protein n=1 Tax=Duganella vulcania TaxID=2692166 RepID=A0A845GBI5_9BURK|nr:hypothetical protein [Duganella vulcania]MYM90218.1 hypothetical protein [Duganella vulcania]
MQLNAMGIPIEATGAFVIPVQPGLDQMNGAVVNLQVGEASELGIQTRF